MRLLKAKRANVKWVLCFLQLVLLLRKCLFRRRYASSSFLTCAYLLSAKWTLVFCFYAKRALCSLQLCFAFSFACKQALCFLQLLLWFGKRLLHRRYASSLLFTCAYGMQSGRFGFCFQCILMRRHQRCVFFCGSIFNRQAASLVRDRTWWRQSGGVASNR